MELQFRYLKETEKILKLKIRQLKIKKKYEDEYIEQKIIEQRENNSSEEYDRVYKIKTPKEQK